MGASPGNRADERARGRIASKGFPLVMRRPRGLPTSNAPRNPWFGQLRAVPCQNHPVSERSALIVAIVTLVVVAGTGAGAYLRSRNRNSDIDAP